jgi:SAM-dependent methyltransferase
MEGMMSADTSIETVRATVREKYAARARAVGEAEPTGSCCGETSSCCSANTNQVTSNLYGCDEVAAIPEAAIKASLGCGNPTALASLSPGETVLDLGSGGGIDVLLSAQRVGPTGFVYGLDMTDEMLALAERNRAEQGATNVKFLKGHIEEIPLPDDAVDVVISNCVINLSADKGQVLREVGRVLKPGGRFAVSDVVVQGAMPDELRRDMEAWVGCIAGALEEGEYRRLLDAAGLGEIDVEVTREYDPRAVSDGAGRQVPATVFEQFEASGGRIVAAFVRARKPG